MKSKFVILFISLICLSSFSEKVKAEQVPIGGFEPVASDNNYDLTVLQAKALALTWIQNASSVLTEKGKVIAEVAIDRLKKSTFRRPITPDHPDALFNCKTNNRLAMVLRVNPLDVYLCPETYNRLKNGTDLTVFSLAQTLVHESYHLFEFYNGSGGDEECKATEFEVGVVEANRGCITYPSYSKSCNISVNFCR